MFRRLALLPLVLGCSRPLVDVDTENSEVIQETPDSLLILPPYACRALHQLHEHDALRQSRALHARQTFSEQDPPPAHNYLGGLISHLNKHVLVRNWGVGMTLLSPTDEASQEAMMSCDSACRSGTRAGFA